MAKTVVFDFDGVIHSYTSGWLGETTIPDPPVPGIQKALKEIHDAGYEVVVVSTRCKTALGRMAIENWIDMYGMTQEVDKVCKEKPPAIAYIDDRAICFDGHPENLLKKIKNFQPWYKKPILTPPNEWISVEDEIPSDDDDGLEFFCMTNATGKGGGVLPLEWEVATIRGKTVRRWRWLNRISPWTVTHWMKRPAPPEKENSHE
jgi:hypothetical protein